MLAIEKQRPSLVPEAIRTINLDSSAPPELTALTDALRRLGLQRPQETGTSGKGTSDKPR